MQVLKQVSALLKTRARIENAMSKKYILIQAIRRKLSLKHYKHPAALC
jgi:hypothetical protein